MPTRQMGPSNPLTQLDADGNGAIDVKEFKKVQPLIQTLNSDTFVKTEKQAPMYVGRGLGSQ